MRSVLGEVLTAIVTPFRADGSIDVEAFQELAGFLLDNGSDGIVVAGTTGEAPTLSDDERQTLFEAAVDSVGDRGSVVAGTGTYSTAHSVHLTERAQDAGVDGFLVVTPYYNKPPQRGIVAHVEAVAAATDRPVVFYDIPSRVVIEAEPATIARLAEIDNVRGVKQAKPSIDAARNVVASGLDLYAGDDDLILPFLEVGGVGGICVHTHLVGPQVKELIASYRAGDVERGHALDEEIGPAIAIGGILVLHRLPDRREEGAAASRARRRRAPPPARRGRRNRDRRDPRLPRAARTACGGCVARA